MSKVFEQKDDEYYYFQALQIIKQKPNELDKLEDFENILKIADKKSDDTFVYDEFNSLLHEACYFGNLSIVKLLLAGNFKINSACDFEGIDDDETLLNDVTPLHLACYKGHQDIVDSLIASEADINVTNYWGDTALHFAVKANHMAIVELLVCHQANTDLEDYYGCTSFDLAKDPSEIAKLIKNKIFYSENSGIGFFDKTLDTENNNVNEAPSLNR